MMTRPTAVLVLLLACVSWPSWPRCAARLYTDVEHPEPSFGFRLKLFEHVLLNDAEWLPVLKIRVKLSEIDLPRFTVTATNSATVDRIRLVAKDAQETTPWLVLQKLMEKRPWLGTNVNYAASVLSTAFTCFTYNNVSILLSHINEINEIIRVNKTVLVKNENINRMLDDVRMTLQVFMDTVAAVNGDLEEFVKGLYDYDCAENDGSDIIQFKVLKLLKDNMEKDLNKKCYPVDSSKIDNLCKWNTQNTSPSESISESVLSQKLSRFDDIVECIIDVYDRLDVKELSMDTWIRILEYKIPISKKINFFIDDKLMEKSPEGLRTERFKKALELANEEETEEVRQKKKEVKKLIKKLKKKQRRQQT